MKPDKPLALSKQLAHMESPAEIDELIRPLVDALEAAPTFGGEPKSAFGREFREWQITAREALQHAKGE